MLAVRLECYYIHLSVVLVWMGLDRSGKILGDMDTVYFVSVQYILHYGKES